MQKIIIQQAKDFLEIQKITEIERCSITGVRKLTDQNEIIETKIEAIGFEMIAEIVEFITEVKDSKYRYKGSFTALFEHGKKHYNNDVELLIDEQKENLSIQLNRILELGTELIRFNND